ncbi:MAG: hypothetical protein QM488_05000 [Rhizobiaceae bacterium]
MADIWNYLFKFMLLLTGRLGGALAIFLVNIMVARNLGMEALGTYAVFVSMVSILTICLPLGYNSVASIFTTEYITTDQPGLLKGYVVTSVKQILLSATFLTLLLFAGWFLFPQFIQSNQLGLGIVILVTAMGTSLLNLNSAIMVGMKHQVAGLLPEMLIRPVFLLLGVFVLFSLHSATGINAVLGISAIATWIAVIISSINMGKLRAFYQNSCAKYNKHHWRDATYPWLATSLLWDYLIDLILLLTSIMAGAAELAVLYICFRYRVLAGFGMRTIYLLLMPEITEHAVLKNTDELTRKISLANQASLIYSIAVIAFFALFGNQLISLFSTEITDALPILVIVSFTMVIRAVFGPATLVLAVHNLHKITAAISLAGLIIAIAAILLFYSTYGILAAAIAYSLSNLFISASLWRYSKIKTGIDSSVFANIHQLDMCNE